MAQTIFSRILAGEIPVRKVFEDEHCLAFHDVEPQAPVHLLVIPREPVESLAQLSGEHEALAGHLLHVAGMLGRQHCPGGFRVIANSGEDGGQTVMHLHLHVLGGRHLAWPPG